MNIEKKQRLLAELVDLTSSFAEDAKYYTQADENIAQKVEGFIHDLTVLVDEFKK